jgi:hypothetical protein
MFEQCNDTIRFNIARNVKSYCIVEAVSETLAAVWCCDLLPTLTKHFYNTR